MKKLHPNSFVTFKATWVNSSDRAKNAVTEITVPLKTILRLEKVNSIDNIKLDNFNDIFFANYENLQKCYKGTYYSCQVQQDNSKAIIYYLSEQTYLELKNILCQIDWRFSDKSLVSTIVKEQVKEEVAKVKEEIIKTKHSSPIMSLEIE